MCFLGECPRHEAAFITSGRYSINATVFCDSTGGRGAAIITVIIIVDNNGGMIEDNGEV